MKTQLIAFRIDKDVDEVITTLTSVAQLGLTPELATNKSVLLRDAVKLAALELLTALTDNPATLKILSQLGDPEQMRSVLTKDDDDNNDSPA